MSESGGGDDVRLVSVVGYMYASLELAHVYPVMKAATGSSQEHDSIAPADRAPSALGGERRFGDSSTSSDCAAHA